MARLLSLSTEIAFRRYHFKVALPETPVESVHRR